MVGVTTGIESAWIAVPVAIGVVAWRVYAGVRSVRRKRVSKKD